MRSPASRGLRISGFQVGEGISPRTVKSDRSMLNRFLATLGDDGDVGRLAPLDVTRFMGQCAHMGVQTRSIMLYAIRSFAMRATEKGFCGPSMVTPIPTITAHKGEGCPRHTAPSRLSYASAA